MGPPPATTLAVTFSFEKGPRPEEAGAVAPAAAAESPLKDPQEGEVLVTMVISGASWHVQVDKGATGRELRQAVAVASGIPAREIKLMRESGGALIGDSEEASAEKQECVFMVRVRKPRVLVTFTVVGADGSIGGLYGAPKQHWVENPEDTKWRILAQRIFGLYAPLVFQFPAVHFSTDHHSALRDCSVASLANGEITDEVLERDRLHWLRLEAEELQRAKDNLFQWRLEAVQSGMSPCGCGWCNCSDFKKAFDVRSGRLCQCGHSIFEHMGEKFNKDSRTPGIGRGLLGTMFGHR